MGIWKIINKATQEELIPESSSDSNCVVIFPKNESGDDIEWYVSYSGNNGCFAEIDSLSQVKCDTCEDEWSISNSVTEYNAPFDNPRMSPLSSADTATESIQFHLWHKENDVWSIYNTSDYDLNNIGVSLEILNADGSHALWIPVTVRDRYSPDPEHGVIVLGVHYDASGYIDSLASRTVYLKDCTAVSNSLIAVVGNQQHPKISVIVYGNNSCPFTNDVYLEAIRIEYSGGIYASGSLTNNSSNTISGSLDLLYPDRPSDFPVTDLRVTSVEFLGSSSIYSQYNDDPACMEIDYRNSTVNHIIIHYTCSCRN